MFANSLNDSKLEIFKLQTCISSLLSVKLFANTFKIYQILKELFDGNANWYDFTIGIISILLLIGLKELKKRAKDYDSLRKGFNAFTVELLLTLFLLRN